MMDAILFLASFMFSMIFFVALSVMPIGEKFLVSMLCLDMAAVILSFEDSLEGKMEL